MIYFNDKTKVASTNGLYWIVNANNWITWCIENNIEYDYSYPYSKKINTFELYINRHDDWLLFKLTWSGI